MSTPTWSARGGDRRDARALVPVALALACVCPTSHAEQFPNADDGFYVDKTKDELTMSADGDNVGWQQIIEFEGIGGSPTTVGSNFKGSIIFGVTARKCPTVDGIVKGKGTWSVTYNRHMLQADGANDSLLSLLVTVDYTGHVGDDARLNLLEAETTYQRASSGGIRTNRGPLLNTQTTPTHQTLKSNYTVKDGKFGDFGITELDPMKAHLDEAASITAILGFQAEQVFKDAELNWLKGNCVEIKFDPATSTTRVGPSESVRVKAELKTKKESTTVAAGFEDAAVISGGTVTPKQDRSGVGTPVTFTYTAPKDKAGNKGFGVGARSRAGAAFGEWSPLGLGAVKFDGLSFTCVIPVPGAKDKLYLEDKITGESCADPGTWTIRPTRISRGAANQVKVDKPFTADCVPVDSPEAETKLRAARARPAGGGIWVCTYAPGENGAVEVTYWNFKSSFCEGAKEEHFTVTAHPTSECGKTEPPPPPQRKPPPKQEPPPPSIPKLPPL